MKILINAVAAKSGGAATYLYNLVQGLAGSGHQYILYVPSSTVKILGRISSGNIKVISTDIGFKSAWKRFFWDQITLRRIAKKENIDILLSSSDFGMLFPPCPQILMIRNSLFFSNLYLEKFLPVKSKTFQLEFFLRRWLVVLCGKQADIVMVASKNMLSDIQKFLPRQNGKVVVNYFGVSEEKFDNPHKLIDPSQARTFRILYVSEYSDYKNLTTLLKALMLLRDQDKNNFCLTTTADPSQFPKVEITTRKIDQSLISDPRIAPYVKTADSVPYQEVQKLYQENDVFIFPSLVESFGHPLVEAMASGLAIVASDIPICREICGEAAVYFDPLNPDDLAEKILVLRNDPSLRQKLGMEGRRRAETQFDWKSHVSRLMEIMKQVGGKPQLADRKTFSYALEKKYYSRWPQEAKPYQHLESYLRCWLDPDSIFRGKRILDIGAGECTYTRLIADKFAPEKIVACELFREQMLPAARANINTHLNFIAGDCFQLPFRSGAFDVVFASLTLHQLPNLTEIISEIRRILADDGIFVGIEPNPHHPLHLWRYFAGRHSPNQYLFGPKHLALFKEQGFDVHYRYFYAKFPILGNRFLGTCMGITARKVNQECKTGVAA